MFCVKCLKIHIFIGLSLILFACQNTKKVGHLLGSSVVKVIGHNVNNRMSMGSGVVVAENRVATNCHVTGAAHDITVIKNSVQYKVIAQTSEIELDLCLLHLTGLNLPVVAQADPTAVMAGDKVVAYGYPDAVGISMRQGKITRLHPFRSSFIIETDIGIRGGASGGGLFNEQGQLLGLTTFFRKDRGGRYFIIPANWLDLVMDRKGQGVTPLIGLPFWQLPIDFEKNND